MRINVFTAPAIGLYLNKLRRDGRADDVEEFLFSVRNAINKRRNGSAKLYYESERFTPAEIAGIFSLVCEDGAGIALEVIYTILNIGEATESFTGCIKKIKKGVKNSKK